MGLVEDLNKISAALGKAPIDPGIIQGQGAWNPPPIDPDIPAEWLDPELDMGEDLSPKAPPSPLIPRRSPDHPDRPNAREFIRRGAKPPAGFDEPEFPEVAGPMFSLCVADRIASWKTRGVTLLEHEEAAIRAIVLKAIQREVQADLAAVEKPRRTRKPRVTPKTIANTLAHAAAAATDTFAAGNLPARRKPGRPRKTDQK